MTTRQVDVPEYARFDLVDRLHKSLRYARVKPGAMAEYLGVHRNTVGSYLRGSVRPDTRTLKLWAMRCGLPYEWLADGRIDLTDGPDGGGGQENRPSGWIGDVIDLGARRERRLTPLVEAA